MSPFLMLGIIPFGALLKPCGNKAQFVGLGIQIFGIIAHIYFKTV